VKKAAVLAMSLSFCVAASASNAQDDTERRVRELEAQVRALQEQVRTLIEQKTPVAAPVPEETTTDAGSLEDVEVIERPANESVEPPAPGHHQPASGNVFNPDIGVIGNLIAAAGPAVGTSSIAPQPSWTLQESEMSLQSAVDPYARADFFLAFGEEGVEVEEGYVTFNALPAGLLLKGGKFRANFGRLNAFHNHSLPWIDRPIVMFNLLGGSTDEPDTGIKDAGFSVSRHFALGNVFVEATGEVFRGESGAIFKASRRRDLSAVAHLKNYLDLSERANVEAGLSYGRGKNENGSDYATEIYGADFTYRWRPLERAIYRSLALRSELIWSRREQLDGRMNAFGYYASADYQFARRWTTGVRYDDSGRAAEGDLRDRGASAVLTFRPSEFSALRWQYRHSRFAEERSADELLFQVLFVIGAHGAHAF
jgi:hypothetical protein